jgi:hypothetical protein
MDKKPPPNNARIKPKNQAQVIDCKCMDCEYYYMIYECANKITPYNGVKGAHMKALHYCVFHKVSLPVIRGDANYPFPDVKECEDFKKLK